MSGPFIWDSLPLVMDLTPRQALCMNECREAGFHDGAAVCLRGLTGELGGIGVASSTGGRSESAKDDALPPGHVQCGRAAVLRGLLQPP